MGSVLFYVEVWKPSVDYGGSVSFVLLFILQLHVIAFM